MDLSALQLEINTLEDPSLVVFREPADPDERRHGAEFLA
jgi:hypothetical protein